jgi:hypothetical protein
VSNFCHAPDKIGLNKQENIGRLLDRVLLTSSAFVPEEAHVKGFDLNALNGFMGRASSDASPLSIVRSSVFGGTRQFLEVATVALDVLASITLQAGFLGTDEHLLT